MVLAGRRENARGHGVQIPRRATWRWASAVNDYDLVTPSVDIHTVGAGGGTIAGIDSAGLMYAGPEGAGARPGPAAYGLGGTRPKGILGLTGRGGPPHPRPSHGLPTATAAASR